MEAFHPGEFLQEELIARGISLTTAAEKLKMPEKHLVSIIEGKAPITTITALMSEEMFRQPEGTISAEYWLNMQQAWDLQEMRRRIEENPDIFDAGLTSLFTLAPTEQNITKWYENQVEMMAYRHSMLNPELWAKIPINKFIDGVKKHKYTSRNGMGYFTTGETIDGSRAVECNVDILYDELFKNNYTHILWLRNG